MPQEQFRRTVELKCSDFLWVIIPCRNEQVNVESCLNSFRHQTDSRFNIVVVDNGSEDQTLLKVRNWAKANPRVVVDVVYEERPGIGLACRAGCDFAIHNGATMIARTDADSAVDADWVHEAKQSMVNGFEFVAGRGGANQGERARTMLKALVMFRLIQVAVMASRLRRGLPFSSMVMAGFNLGVTAELYQRVGGFTATQINEDVDLHDRILAVTTNGTYNKRMVAYTSLRRIEKTGLIKTLWWYIQKHRQR